MNGEKIGANVRQPIERVKNPFARRFITSIIHRTRATSRYDLTPTRSRFTAASRDRQQRYHLSRVRTADFHLRSSPVPRQIARTPAANLRYLLLSTCLSPIAQPPVSTFPFCRAKTDSSPGAGQFWPSHLFPRKSEGERKNCSLADRVSAIVLRFERTMFVGGEYRPSIGGVVIIFMNILVFVSV